MIFQWLMILVAIITLVVTLYSDALSGKKKHSSYFQAVQIPSGKNERGAVISEDHHYDSFFKKLNSL